MELKAKPKCDDCGTGLGEIRYSEQLERPVCYACYDLAFLPPRCKDNFTSTVEGAAAYERLHGGHR